MIGIVYALGSAILFGASAPLAKLLIGEVSPWLLAGLLYLGSGIGLAILRFFVRSEEAKLTRRDIPWFGAAILSGGIIGPVLMMIGLSTTTASQAALLLNLEGVLTLAIAWIVFKEYVDLRLGIGAGAIVAGAIILSWPTEASLSGELGGIAIAGACLAWGIDNNLTRKVSASDPVQIAMIKGLVSGCVNVALAFAIGAKVPAVGTIAASAIVGFFGYGVSLTLFVLALRFLGTARTGAYFSLAPFIGAGIAILFLGDQITLGFMAAGALMALGLWLHLTEQHQHTHEHEELKHEHLHVHDEHHQHQHDDTVGPEPHSHPHKHVSLVHRHAHFPDIHHRHSH